MATGLVTKRAVDGLSAGAATFFLWDTEVKGFGLKITPAGARSYVYQYRLGGRGAPVKRFAIGAHGAWTPDAARKEARRLAQLVDTGTDPSADKQRTRRVAAELAFSAYAERFIAEYLASHWKGGHELAAGILRRDVIPAFARKNLPEITRVDVTTLMDRLAQKPATRRNAFTILRRLFRWAVNRGDLATSPLQDMNGPPAPASRDRVLTDDEVAKVWAASLRAGYPFGPFVRMLILTGQRREEVAGLDWHELNRDKRLWSLPAARAKNGVVHDVPLSDDMVALLDVIAPNANSSAQERRWPNDGLVFSTKEGTHITGYSKAKIRIDALIALAMKEEGEVPSVMAPWRFHDLRRTLATGLQRLGVRFEVTEAVLNHISGSRSGIAGVYQRHNWQAEKRAALADWSAHVLARIAARA